MPLTISIHTPSSTSKINATSSEEVTLQDEGNALHKFQALLYAFLDLIQENRQLLSSRVDEQAQRSVEQTGKIKGMMDSSGWTGLEMAALGATLASLSSFAPHLSAANTTLQGIFESLGGVDNVKNLLESSSKLVTGVKPTFDTWQQAQLLPEQDVKEILRTLQDQGRSTVRHCADVVPQLLHIADEVRNKWSEGRYRN